MRNKIIIATGIIAILLVIVLLFSQKETQQVNPGLSLPTPTPAISYNDSTDLKKELDTINPQILDSDFE